MHIKTHQLDPNARPLKTSRHGRVKLRDTRPNEHSTNQPSDTSPMNQDLPSASEDLSPRQDLPTAAEDLPSASNQDLPLHGEIAVDDIANTEDCEDDGCDEREVVDISMSDDEEEPNVGEKRSSAGLSKSRQLKAHRQAF